ncbi:MAG TPA: hypothetical protein VFA11_03805 [Acidimicrobiales bacterium]|nr:hypothetical protein [Acidimicrobiales bacterium]
MRVRRPAVATALAGAALVAGWLGGLFGAAPPVYDGLPLSAEPYRYLQPPPGLATTAPPTSATKTVTVTPQASAETIDVSTAEAPPQASILFSTDGLAAPAGTSVVVRITPVPPPAPPKSGRIDGNVYQFSASAGSAPVGLGAAGTVANLELRATGAPGNPTIERFDGTSWRAVPTTHVPPSEYTTDSNSLGDFALVLPPGPPPGAGGPGTGVVAGIVVGAVLLVIGGLLWILRRTRRRRPPPAAARGRPRR